MKRGLLLLIGILGWPLWAAAQVAYVDDYVRVNLRPEPTPHSVPLGVVVSGERLEVLERRPDYIRVRTADGRSGWVAAPYLTARPPASLRVRRLDAEIARLRAELDGLERLLGEAPPPAAAPPPQASAAEPPRRGWLLILPLFFGLVGFGGGFYYYRQQILRRLGGFRLHPIV